MLLDEMFWMTTHSFAGPWPDAVGGGGHRSVCQEEPESTQTRDLSASTVQGAFSKLIHASRRSKHKRTGAPTCQTHIRPRSVVREPMATTTANRVAEEPGEDNPGKISQYYGLSGLYYITY